MKALRMTVLYLTSEALGLDLTPSHNARFEPQPGLPLDVVHRLDSMSLLFVAFDHQLIGR